VVTQIKSLEAKTKRKARTPESMYNLPVSTHAHARRPRKVAVGGDVVKDSADAQINAGTQQGSHSKADKALLNQLLERGKDLVSGDTASVVEAAAIVVGAAVIEMELIPGLIIGTFVRPAIKATARASFPVMKKARQAIPGTSERVHDLVGDVKYEERHPRAAKKAQVAAESAGEPRSVHWSDAQQNKGDMHELHFSSLAWSYATIVGPT
jgi:hypothetical protein